MDFTLPDHAERYRVRVADFVAEHVLPLEDDPESFADHGNLPPARLAPLREKAKAAGLWLPQLPEAEGGLGLPCVALPAA